MRADVNAAWDLAAHDISVVSYWLDAEPLSATAAGGSWLKAGNEDAVFATLGYPGGILLNLQSSWLSPCKVREITVVGEEGLLTFDDMSLSEPVRDPSQARSWRGRRPRVPRFLRFLPDGPGRGRDRGPEVRRPRAAQGGMRSLPRLQSSAARARSRGRSGLAVVRALEMIERALRANGREEPVAGRGPKPASRPPRRPWRSV